MKREDGALYAIALVAAGAAAGMAARSMREAQGSQARSATKDFATGSAFAAVIVSSLPRAATLLVLLSKSERTTPLIFTVTALAVSTVIAPPAATSRR